VKRSLPLWPLIVALGAGLIFWNYLPLREHSVHVRMKDLSFVPNPILGRMLCFGQCSAASELEWIDSFTYFELQLEKRNDTLVGSGESGFRRLYDQLIAEDPYNQLYYEHASFNIGALDNRHDLALGFLLTGIYHLPHCTTLWRQAASELYNTLYLETQHAQDMDAFLDAWANAELDNQQRRQVWDWKGAMARRHQVGLSQMAYWQEQLSFNKPDSSAGMYILAAMRDQVGRYDIAELQALVEDYATRHMMTPLQLGDVLEPAAIHQRYPHGLTSYLPFTISQGRPVLRCDPFGYPYHFDHATVISPGLEHARLERLMSKLDLAINRYLKNHPQAGAFPTSTGQVTAWGIEVPAIPPEAHYVFRAQEHDVVVTWDPPPFAPWTFNADQASLQP